jgi:hypothetical protein
VFHSRSLTRLKVQILPAPRMLQGFLKRMLTDVILRARGLGRSYRMGEVEVVALHENSLEIARSESIEPLGPTDGRCVSEHHT